ncbi:MAG: Fic family protein [Candidatus Micrarchaeia archaeon]
MHVEIRESGEHRKYYLAHSYRKNGRVLKLRFYLGLDLNEAEVEVRKKIGEKEILERIARLNAIQDPYITALSPSELEGLKTLEAKGGLGISHLSEEEWARFTEAFTYDTNAIEGSTVEAKEVADVLEKRKWPRDRSKEEIAETYGVAEAIRYVRKAKEHISLKLILELHRIVFKNSKMFAGEFRKKGVEVVVADARGNIVHRGAPSAEVRGMLNELVRWYAKNMKRYSPLVLAAVVHNQFENIHPFQDGNGRVGRLLLNNILLKHNMPPLNIELRNRREYYDALQTYEKEHNLRPTIELMLKEYRNLKKMLKKA